MTQWRIGCGQITWPRDVSDEKVMGDIAAAGYDGAPAYPKPATMAADRVALFARFGLAPAPGYMGADFWDVTKYDAIIAQAQTYAAFARDVGCDCCYVAANTDNQMVRNGRTRMQAAGHVTPADAMSDAEWRQFIRTISDVGAIMQRHGVTAAFHNHVGSVIETRAELDYLMQQTDPALLALGPDTGHAAWAGDDVTDMVRTYATRIVTMHLKDVNPTAIATARAQNADYRGAERLGVWTELGQGCVDFPAIFAHLKSAGFTGWLIVETDVTQLPSARESATQSRAYLRSLGL